MRSSQKPSTTSTGMGCFSCPVPELLHYRRMRLDDGVLGAPRFDQVTRRDAHPESDLQDVAMAARCFLGESTA